MLCIIAHTEENNFVEAILLGIIMFCMEIKKRAGKKNVGFPLVFLCPDPR